MLTLTAVQNTQPDYVALAIVLALAIVVAVMALRKRFGTKAAKAEPAAEAVPVPEKAPVQAAAPGSAGEIKLHNVEPKTASMIMAIVANKLEKPLNELRFISIKEVE